MVEVRAELIGNLWKVQVKEGDQVSAEDILVILESMKMEIPITAPVAGTVHSVLAREGEVVEEGQVVVLLEPSAGTEPS